MIAWAGIERFRGGARDDMDLIARPRWPLDATRRADDRVRQEGGQGMIGVIGAGAFGTALAVALGRDGREVRLWARDARACRGDGTQRAGTSAACRVLILPESVTVTAEIGRSAAAEALLAGLPMQALGGFLCRPSCGV